MTDVNKDDVIKSVYFDRAGFGSVATTFKDAKTKEPSITLNDVKEWFKKKCGAEKETKRHKLICSTLQ